MNDVAHGWHKKLEKKVRQGSVQKASGKLVRHAAKPRVLQLTGNAADPAAKTMQVNQTCPENQEFFLTFCKTLTL